MCIRCVSSRPASQGAEGTGRRGHGVQLVGIYVGGHVGGGWGEKDWVAVGVAPLGSHDVDGFLGGGQLGFNYQTGPWVFGAEVDFSWADLNGSFTDARFSWVTTRPK